MPKIHIYENDQTSPGTPDSYSNYKVLITGIMPNASSTTNASVKPDANGVYEFNNKQDFINTIGTAGPELDTYYDEGNTHYGNQMAYELLNLGYSIIYKPIGTSGNKSAILEMNDAKFWEIFKDKANYDFRFVTHGLLKSGTPSPAYLNNKARLEELADAQSKLDDIAGVDAETEYSKIYGVIAEEFGFSASEISEDNFNSLSLMYKGLAYRTGDSTYAIYTTFTEACTGVAAETSQCKTDIEAYESQSLVNDAVINSINSYIAELANYEADSNSTGRGDCVALLELDENSYNNYTTSENAVTQIITAANKLSTAIGTYGTYCTVTVPSVTYNMSDDTRFDNNKTFPGAFHYLACFMNSLRSGFKEWYAAAGYSRGVSNYAIASTTVKLGEIAINALEPRNSDSETDIKISCNVIANFRGSYYLWGNRTAHLLGKQADGADLVAKHFLNIRQLCTTVKKQLYIACRRFTFDPNSDALWVNFVNAIKPTLEEMKADQGIRDYKVLKVYEENPKKATLKAKIRIIPIEAVEDFDIEVRLEDTFGETTVVAD
jgi:hypothetical protein